MRRTPMKRTGFKSRAPTHTGYSEQDRAERRSLSAASLLASATPRAATVGGSVTGAAAPKREYVRSKALREAYRLIPCQACGADDGTVVCAHANESWAGKGMGIKACDSRAASLCYSCHVRLDQGSDMTREQRRAFWLAAHIKTIAALVTGGHWPKHIPSPQPVPPESSAKDQSR